MDYAFIGGINFGMALIFSPLVTILTRRVGPNITMMIGVFFQTVGWIGASFAHEIWHLYLTQGVAIGIGLGFTFIPSLAILSQWFKKKRSLANGISSAGSGIGGLIFSFATQAIIDNISLAWAYRITGICAFAANATAALLIRDRNKFVKPPQLGFDLKLLRRYDVWILLAWGFIMMFGYMTILYSISDWGRSIGLSATKASSLTAILNAGTAIGRPIIGIASDKYGRLQVAGIITFLNTVAVFAIWLPAKSYGVAVFFSLVSGAILGVFWPTVAPVSVEVVGLPELPSILSIFWIFVAFPTTFAEVIALKIRRPNSNRPYLYPELFSGLAYLVASLCMLELMRVKRKQRNLEKRAKEEAEEGEEKG